MFLQRFCRPLYDDCAFILTAKMASSPKFLLSEVNLTFVQAFDSDRKAHTYVQQSSCVKLYRLRSILNIIFGGILTFNDPLGRYVELIS
jgi:hypothetical protein